MGTRHLAIAMLAAGTLLAGCGDDEPTRASGGAAEAVAGWSEGRATVTIPLGKGQELATPAGAIRAWTAALNERDWKRACGISLVTRAVECESTLSDAVRGRVEVEDTDANETARADGGAFTATGLAGIEDLSVEPQLGGYRVHFEVRRIR
jgi:hypothetical protein